MATAAACAIYKSCETCVRGETNGTLTNGVRLACMWCISTDKCTFIDVDDTSTCPEHEIARYRYSCPGYFYEGFVPIIIFGILLVGFGFFSWFMSVNAANWRSRIVEESDAEGNTYMTLSSPQSELQNNIQGLRSRMQRAMRPGHPRPDSATAL